MEAKKKKKNGVGKFIKKIVKNQIFKILAPCILVGVICLGVGSQFMSEPKSTKFGLEDIGELATQVAYITEVDVINDPRTVFGFEIPFTQSHYIYSYDFIVKAGFDVEDIIPTVNEKAKTVTIQLPKAKILSTEQKLDSLKIYLEDESIFNQVTMSENNEALIKLKENAEQTAIDNGLLKNAEENAKAVLTGLFANHFNPKEYTYNFKFK